MNVAEAEKLKIEASLIENTYTPLSKITIKEYFEKWLETPAAKKLASKTYVNYKNCINFRIVPWIGHIKLSELKRSDLLTFYNKIYEVGQLERGRKTGKTVFKPVGKDTVGFYHGVIRRILSDAVYKDEIILRNVAEKMDLPEPELPADYDPDQDLVKVFTQAEITVLEKHAADTSYHAIIFVALRTGMRRGDCSALRGTQSTIKTVLFL